MPDDTVNQLPALTARDKVRMQVRTTVLSSVDSEHGPGATHEVPIPGFASLIKRVPVDARHGITAALLAEGSARQLVADYVLQAREDGITWAGLAPALGVDDEDEAYERVVGNYHASWRCPSCSQNIQDYGPAHSHPEDREENHAVDCARLVAEITAWRDRRGDDD